MKHTESSERHPVHKEDYTNKKGLKFKRRGSENELLEKQTEKVSVQTKIEIATLTVSFER